MNSHGEIDRWSILDQQYQSKSSDGAVTPYILTTMSPEFKADNTLRAPFLSPMLQVKVNKRLLRGEYELVPGTSTDEVTMTFKSPLVEVKKNFKVIKGAFRLAANIEVINRSPSSVQVEIIGVSRALQSDAESGRELMYIS